MAHFSIGDWTLKLKLKRPKLRTLDQQIIAIMGVFLLVSAILVMPGAPFALSVIEVEEPLIGPVTKGDFIIFYSMFAATISVILFVWAWIAYRNRH